MESRDAGSLSRRAWARVALWGAVGVSLLPGCRRKPGDGTVTCYVPVATKGGGGGGGGSLLSRWAELGRVWRELSKHNTDPGQDREQRLAEFATLRAEMQAALDALPAWPELRLVFEERALHIDALRYSLAMCYAAGPGGSDRPRVAVEEQVAALHKLVEEGKLTEAAASKAAAVLAKQAEYYAQSDRLRDTEAAPPPDKVKALEAQHREGALKPSDAATLAGKRLVELTVDALGMLAGAPTEAELPKPDPPEDDAKEGAP